MVYLDSNAKQRLLDAAQILSSSFDWAQSPQGHSYWSQVHVLLGILASQAPINNNASAVTGRVASTPILKNERGVQEVKLTMVHIYDKGSSLCGLKGDPSTWKTGNLYVRLTDKHKSTCNFCKAKAPL